MFTSQEDVVRKKSINFGRMQADGTRRKVYLRKKNKLEKGVLT